MRSGWGLTEYSDILRSVLTPYCSLREVWLKEIGQRHVLIFGDFRKRSGGINSVQIHPTHWSELVAPGRAVSVLTPKFTSKMGDREEDWEQPFEERFLLLFRNQANIHLLWHYNLN